MRDEGKVTLSIRRSASRPRVFGWGAFAVLAICVPARADERGLTFSYEAPAECPTAEELRVEVERLATRQTKPFSASIVIGHDARHFTARISSSDGTERAFVGNACAEVAEAIAVVLALAMTPSPQAEVPHVPPQNVVKPSRASEPLNRPNQPSGPVRFRAGAAMALDQGTLPHLDLGASGRVGAVGQTWATAFEGTYWLPTGRALASAPNLGGHFSLWTVLASGCFAPRDRAPRIELCAGPELGRLAGRGYGIDFPRSSARFRFSLQAMAELHLPLYNGVRLRAGLGAGAVLFGRHAFQIDALGTVFTPQVVSGRASLGAELVF